MPYLLSMIQSSNLLTYALIERKLPVKTFEFSTDWKVARDFYDLVEANLSLELDLFTKRDRFLGCVYCKTGEKIAGLFSLTEKDGKGYVDSGYVAHAQRGKGIGFKLLEEACNRLIAMGKTPVCFIVRSRAMDRLIDKLSYPAGTIRKEEVLYDQNLEDLIDFLFSEDEKPPQVV